MDVYAARIAQLKGKEVKPRLEACQQILQDLSKSQPPSAIDENALYFALCECINDVNPRVSELAMRCIILLDQYYPDLIPSHNIPHLAEKNVLEKLGDMRSGPREAASDLILCLMSASSALKDGIDQLLQVLITGFQHKNGKVRYGIISCLHKAFDTFGSDAVDWKRFVLKGVINALEDSSQEVREAAMDFLASLNTASPSIVAKQLSSSSLRKATIQTTLERLGLSANASDSNASLDSPIVRRGSTSMLGSQSGTSTKKQKQGGAMSSGTKIGDKSTNSGSLFPALAPTDGETSPPTFIYGSMIPKGAWQSLANYPMPPGAGTTTKSDVAKLVIETKSALASTNWQDEMRGLHILLGLAIDLLNAPDNHPLFMVDFGEMLYELQGPICSCVTSRRTTLSREACIALSIVLLIHAKRQICSSAMISFVNCITGAAISLLKSMNNGVFSESSAVHLLQSIIISIPPKNIIQQLMENINGANVSGIVKAHLIDLLILVLDYQLQVVQAKATGDQEINTIPAYSRIGDIISMLVSNLSNSVSNVRRIARLGLIFIANRTDIWMKPEEMYSCTDEYRLIYVKLTEKQVKGINDEIQTGDVIHRGEMVSDILVTLPSEIRPAIVPNLIATQSSREEKQSPRSISLAVKKPKMNSSVNSYKLGLQAEKPKSASAIPKEKKPQSIEQYEIFTRPDNKQAIIHDYSEEDDSLYQNADSEEEVPQRREEKPKVSCLSMISNYLTSAASSALARTYTRPEVALDALAQANMIFQKEYISIGRNDGPLISGIIRSLVDLCHCQEGSIAISSIELVGTLCKTLPQILVSTTILSSIFDALFFAYASKNAAVCRSSYTVFNEICDVVDANILLEALIQLIDTEDGLTLTGIMKCMRIVLVSADKTNVLNNLEHILKTLKKTLASDVPDLRKESFYVLGMLQQRAGQSLTRFVNELEPTQLKLLNILNSNL